MKFKMDWDNIPGKGTLMLFKDNEDGTMSLAMPEDVEKAIKEATAPLEAQLSRLKEILKARDEALKNIGNVVGGPLMGYSSAEVRFGEACRMLFQASQIVQQALSKTWEEWE